MAMVLELLKSREVVEKEFRRPVYLDKDAKHTLYDHIDQEAVDSLNITVAECMERLKQLAKEDNEKCMEALKGIRAVELSPGEDISVTWAGVYMIKALVDESRTVVQDIERDAESTDHHCEQLRETIRDLEATGGVLSMGDYDVLFRDTSEIAMVVDDMEEALDGVQRRTEEVHVRGLQYSVFYEDSLKQFEAIRKVSGIVKEYAGVAGPLQDEIGRLTVQLDGCMEDLWGLMAWYRGFHSAYDGLISEVHRRRQAQKALHAVVEDMRSRLESLYMAEMSERARFVDKAGMYLPSDLCPFIQDPPVQFVVEEVGDAERFGSVQSHETRYSRDSVPVPVPVVDDNVEEQQGGTGTDNDTGTGTEAEQQQQQQSRSLVAGA
ncbi:hypothetical protein GGI07_002276 [Coemansia sp. Benny D115]|nr:hypothetical protein GGI07_002276 [Coemansia sp. Benny D115]